MRRRWRRARSRRSALRRSAGAWFFEYVLGIKPCPMCLEQRYAYYLVIVLGAVLALAAPRLPRALAIAALAVLALAAFGNSIFGAFHAGVEWGFWQGPATCSGPLQDLGSAGDLLQRLDTVKVIRCDEVQWRFLGLSLAGYNFLISGLMGLVALFGIRRMRTAGLTASLPDAESTFELFEHRIAVPERAPVPWRRSNPCAR